MTKMMYQRPRQGRSRSKTGKYTAAGAVDRCQTNVLYKCLRPPPYVTNRDSPRAPRRRCRRSRRLRLSAPRPAALVLTGIVTTDDVIVSPQIGGQIEQLLVKEGDAVKKGQLVAVIVPDELRAETAYYTHNVAGLSSQVQESEAALRFQRAADRGSDSCRPSRISPRIRRRRWLPRPPISENARLVYSRTENLSKRGVVSPQELDQSRTAANAAQAKLDALKKQVDAQRAAVRACSIHRRADGGAPQPGAGERALEGRRRNAQRTKADVRLRYTELHAPIDGIV